ncbi:hypothetical protein Dimus_009508 [Dionaea muscipula]
MDLKGVSWVENMYQKFEAMCMEVEESMFEDTVQYVENQARTVGACLKKFYSDAMQDLLLESCIDPIKAENPVQGLAHCADVGTYERPIVVEKNEPIKIKKAVRKISVSFHVGKQMDDGFSSNTSNANNLCKPLPQDTTVDQWSDWEWEQNESDPGFRVNSTYKFASSEISSQTTTTAKEIGVECRDTEPHGEDGATQIETLGSDPALVCEGGVICEETSDTNERVASTPFDSPLLIMDLDEVGTKRMEFLQPPDGTLLSELDVMKPTDKESSAYLNMQNVEEHTLPDSVRPNYVNEIKTSDSEDVGVEVTRLLDSTNLEGSCVLVNKNGHRSLSQLPGKQRSYKKKFRDAFSPRKWSKSKEHEQVDTCMTNSGERNLESLDACESEWELI